MTKTLLSSGLIAGVCAGLVVALLQFWLIQPLIVEAERYETGALILPSVSDGDQADASSPSRHEGMAAHETDLARAGLTVAFLMLTWCGFGLLASASVAAAELVGATRPIAGVEIALAGFAVVAVAPALGLPPELPGMPAAELGARQAWWIMSALATAFGLALVLRSDKWAVRAIAIAVVAFPHLWGAPTAPVSVPTVPPDLAALYVARVIGVSFLGWLVVGTFLERLNRNFRATSSG